MVHLWIGLFKLITIFSYVNISTTKEKGQSNTKDKFKNKIGNKVQLELWKEATLPIVKENLLSFVAFRVIFLQIYLRL